MAKQIQEQETQEKRREKTEVVEMLEREGFYVDKESLPTEIFSDGRCRENSFWRVGYIENFEETKGDPMRVVVLHTGKTMSLIQSPHLRDVCENERITYLEITGGDVVNHLRAMANYFTSHADRLEANQEKKYPPIPDQSYHGN